MEVIKRKISLEDSTNRSSIKNWGAITATTFYVNILLTQNIDDMGLFTDMDFVVKDKVSTAPDYSILKDKLTDLGLSFPFMTNITPFFNTITTPYNLWNVLRFPEKVESYYYNYINSVITGITESRIEDVRSYDLSVPFKVGFDMNKESYTNYEGNTIVGIDRVISFGEPKKYVFDAENNSTIGTSQQKTGLYFEDYSGTTTVIIDDIRQTVNKTVVRYVGEGFNETNISLSALTKEEYLFGKISPPEVQNDVFIDRGINSVLDKHLRLSEIRNLRGLQDYGNGFYKLNKQ